MRRNDGFTLIEVMVAVSISLVIFSAAMALLVVAFHSSYATVQRTDAMQRGRLALDQITRELRSQVCNGATPPISAGATDKSITFYADLSDGSLAPQQHTLTLDAASNRITDAVADGTPKVVLERAYAAQGIPFLTYYAYPDDQPGDRTPDERLTVPLSATDAARVSRIDVGFLVAPQDTRGTQHATTLQDSIDVRLADPNDDSGSSDSPAPAC